MSDAPVIDTDELRKEFAAFCAELEPSIKARSPNLNQAETLAIIGMAVFKACKELKDEKEELIARLDGLKRLNKSRYGWSLSMLTESE